MTTNPSARKVRLTVGMLIAGIAIVAAACVPPKTPPSTTTTTIHSTTTTTLASTTTTTVPTASCTAGQAAIAPNPVVESSQFTDVSLCYSSATAFSNKRLFITQCNEDPATAGFSEGANCSAFSEVTINPGDNTTGIGTQTFTVFYGKEPSGDDRWGCYKPSDTVPGNITKLTTCYLRVTDDSEQNNTDQLTIPFTFAP